MVDLNDAEVARLRRLAREGRLIFLVSGCTIKEPNQTWVAGVHAQAFVDGIPVGQALIEVVNGDWLDAMRRAKRNAAGTWRAIQGLFQVRARMLGFDAIGGDIWVGG